MGTVLISHKEVIYKLAKIYPEKEKYIKTGICNNDTVPRVKLLVLRFTVYRATSKRGKAFIALNFEIKNICFSLWRTTE